MTIFMLLHFAWLMGIAAVAIGAVGFTVNPRERGFLEIACSGIVVALFVPLFFDGRALGALEEKYSVNIIGDAQNDSFESIYIEGVRVDGDRPDCKYQNNIFGGNLRLTCLHDGEKKDFADLDFDPVD